MSGETVSVFDQLETGAAIRAGGLSRFFDGQINPWVGIPQHHLRGWAAQGEVAFFDLIDPLGIGWDPLLAGVSM